MAMWPGFALRYPREIGQLILPGIPAILRLMRHIGKFVIAFLGFFGTEVIFCSSNIQAVTYEHLPEDPPQEVPPVETIHPTPTSTTASYISGTTFPFIR